MSDLIGNLEDRVSHFSSFQESDSEASDKRKKRRKDKDKKHKKHKKHKKQTLRDEDQVLLPSQSIPVVALQTEIAQSHQSLHCNNSMLF